MRFKNQFACRAGILGFVFLWSHFFLLAQTSLEVQTRKQFPESANIQWVKHFKGRVNDFNDVAIVIGFDGMICKGILQYLRSGEQLKLSGILQMIN